MANKKVTDLDQIITAPVTGVMHFVDTTNTSQNAAGSSFKVTKEDFLKENTAAILLNTAKVGYTEALVSANTNVAANTAKVGITTAQASDIITNTAKVGISTGQSSAIVLNTAKVGYTDALVAAAAAVIANTAKTGITTGQASAIVLNTAKVGISAEQSSAIVTNTAKTGYTDTLVAASPSVTANTAKVGITTNQANAIVSNTAKVGVSTVSQTFDGVKTFTSDPIINGINIGRGSGNLVTNAVLGGNAFSNNTSGTFNVILGSSCLASNTTGERNVSVGALSLNAATIAAANVSIGTSAMRTNVSGGQNVAVGSDACRFISDSVTPVTNATSSVFLGVNTRPLADSQTNQLVVGNIAIGLGSNTSVFGNLNTIFGRFFGRLLLGTSVDNGTDALQITGTAKLTSSLQVGNNASAASIGLAGSIRYREIANNSFMEMVMQTGATTYAWVIIKQNTF